MDSAPNTLNTLMTCQELVELVTAYQEGALPAHERRRFEDHLAICPPCVTYVAQMAETARVVGAANDELENATYTQELLGHFRTWKQERTGQPEE